MEVLFVLIPVSLIMAIVAVTTCLMAVRKGQFDDLETPRWRILFDEPPAKGKATEKKGR